MARLVDGLQVVGLQVVDSRLRVDWNRLAMRAAKIAVCVGFTIVGIVTLTQAADDIWVAQNYQELLDQLLPVDIPDGHALRFVVIRIGPNRIANESRIVIRFMRDKSVELSFASVVGEPLADQMLKLDGASEGDSVESLASGIPLQLCELRGADTQTIERLLDEAEKVTMALAPPGLIQLHGTRYEIRSTCGQTTVELDSDVGAPPANVRQPSRALEWAAKTWRDARRLCQGHYRSSR